MTHPSRWLLFVSVLSCIAVSAPLEVAPVPAKDGIALWHGETAQDLHREYYNIFRHGNRNAASHLWTSFLLDRSQHMTPAKLERMFGAFCAVSGSPVNPSDFNRYRLTLDLASGEGTHTGYMHYCCWPCVCDTQDFFKVDTLTVSTSEGPREYHFVVLGNPCLNEEELSRPFVQPFDGRKTTLKQSAPEVRCGADGSLLGSVRSDHGYTVVAMFFAAEAGRVGADETPTPGRVRTSPGGVRFSDEFEWGPMCSDRAAAGYNSGMGEIFRKVAAITPITTSSSATSAVEASQGRDDTGEGTCSTGDGEHPADTV